MTEVFKPARPGRIAGRPVGICCGCWSMNTERSRFGTFYCPEHKAMALRFIAEMEARGWR